MLFFPKRRRRERGSQLVEFALVLIPLLGITFMIMDVAWLYFAQACLQFAVQSGVRYAVTGQVKGTSTQDASIKSVIQSNAMGFLAGSTGLSKITISYYSPSNLTTPLTGSGNNARGNVISIRISNVAVSSFGMFCRTGSARTILSAISTDIVEGAPGG